MSVISSLKAYETEKYHKVCFYCLNKNQTKSWIKHFNNTDKLLNHLKQCVFRNEWSRENRSEIYLLMKKFLENGFNQAVIQRLSELERYA